MQCHGEFDKEMSANTRIVHMYLIMSIMITTITNHSFKSRQKRLVMLRETCREGTQTHNQMMTIERGILKGITHELLGGKDPTHFNQAWIISKFR